MHANLNMSYMSRSEPQLIIIFRGLFTALQFIPCGYSELYPKLFISCQFGRTLVITRQAAEESLSFSLLLLLGAVEFTDKLELYLW